MIKFKCPNCNQTIQANSKNTKIICSCSSPMAIEPKPFKGSKILTLRKSHKMTQAYLADSLGITPGYLSKLETDLYPLPEYLEIKLAELFQTVL